MEFRTEYDLTLSTYAGQLLVKALVAYHEKMCEPTFDPSKVPTVFDVPGVLRIDNLVNIESHTYSSVANPAYSPFSGPKREDHFLSHAFRYDPRDRARSEKTCLNVKFVVWQRAPESVNT